MTTRILLADDHKIVRDGLRSLLEKLPGMVVIGEASDGRAAVQLTKELSPDIVVMDLTMPYLNGIEATQQIRQNSPATRIIALSMHSDKRFVLQVLRAGASGYLLKDSAFEELATAIRAVNANKTYLSPPMADLVLKDYLQQLPKSGPSVYSLLTGREREVLQLIAEGKTTKETASLLTVSVKTVETHRQRIMEKLQIRSVAELVKYAIREGLIPLE